MKVFTRPTSASDFFYMFSRKFKNLSGKLFKIFRKIQNLSMQFYV
jgi:hypothetical protein